ncbi:DUF397 domain-containing protein [Streptomyces sp. UNOC14_S4]|uniref:DUF397 domain-containing protein n=1 Tax=Streptomyces sp. UNOC14_S4 TaxID=2872340 RepID=UPI001E2E299C|nr:DUF397 domain-containing protein [Streptomyces sp. UNOC14_S4]MCC3767868.1 DUF397 domain-containing protein [Streptomyces sp. UNOC14_S4]
MKTSKSSYSNDAEGGDCIEVTPRPQAIHIRDSKRTGAPGLPLPESAWSAFVTYAAASLTA